MPALIALVAGFLGFWLGHSIGKASTRNISLNMGTDGVLRVTDNGKSIKVEAPKGKATIVDMDDPLDIDLGDGSEPKKEKHV